MAASALAPPPALRDAATQLTTRRLLACRCLRLYTAKFYEHEMPDVTTPEIQRTSLVNAVLHLKSLPLNVDVLQFDYLDPPKVGHSPRRWR